MQNKIEQIEKNQQQIKGLSERCSEQSQLLTEISRDLGKLKISTDPSTHQEYFKQLSALRLKMGAANAWASLYSNSIVSLSELNSYIIESLDD